jgi:hypothetical protein
MNRIRKVTTLQILCLGLCLQAVSFLNPTAAFANAQATVTPTQGGPVQRAPLPILYRHFLAYQTHLDRVAAALEKQGKDGNDFRNHFQKKLNFTDEQFALIRASGLRLEAALQKEDAKAKVLIDATRAKFPRSAMGQPVVLPPVPPQLLALQKERDQLIGTEVTNLKSELGSTAAAHLDSLLENDFAPTVTSKPVSLPRAHDPVGHPAPPFPQGEAR